MKILITGQNKLQTHEDFFLKQQLKVVPSHYGLIRALRDMGHEVEQRPVELGENIDHYDRVILFLHNPAGFCAWVYNGLYVLSQRKDAIIAFDDWQIEDIYKGLVKLEADLFRPYVMDKADADSDIIPQYESDYIEAFRQLEKKENKVLLSAFDGGNLDLLIDYPKDKLFRYLPVAYNLNRGGEINDGFKFPGIKEKRYNFSSLVQGKTKKWLKDIDCKWPIDFYGSRKDGQERLKENEMVQVYAKDWACLMPGYYNSGSGWWRARPQQVGDSGSILLGDPKELMVYYEDDYLSNLKPRDIEAMSDDKLKEVAGAQVDALYIVHDILNKETVKQDLDTVLR